MKNLKRYSSVFVVFGFNQYTSISDVDEAIASVSLIGGSCNAGAALLKCQTSLFAGDAGGRKRVLLILLAGESQDDVSATAGAFKAAGVKKISVGMGGLFVQSQLAAMAYSSSYVQYAASYSGLAGIRDGVSGIISEAGAISITGSTAAKPGGCDLAFLVDASSSIGGEQNFRLVLNFVTKVFHSFSLRDGMRYGFVAFGSSVKIVFGFSEYTAMSDIDSAVGSTELLHGTCSADEALYQCGTELFDGSSAGRSKVLIVLMAGKSPEDISNAAGSLKTAGVKMIAIGIGSSFSQAQLSIIASPLLTSNTFNGLLGISESVCSLVSQASGIKESGTALASGGACKTQVDLGFLIDGSGSINYYGAGNFQKCLEFVKSLTRAFSISPTGTRVGAIVFSYRSKLQFSFNQFKTQQEVEAAIGRIKYPGYTTYAGKGLKMAGEKLFNDVRNGVPRVLVVITDGRSKDDIEKASEELRMSGVIIISVGLGTHFDKGQLRVMASSPKKDHVFTVDFSQVLNIVMAIQEKTCKAATTAVEEGTTDGIGSTTGAGGPSNKCFGNSCYMFTKSGKTWTENQNSCKDKGGDLVSMETEEEWKFINSHIQTLTLAGSSEWHIGLKKQGQKWNWVSGKPLTIVKWQQQQPSGDGDVTVMSKDHPAGTQGLFDDLPDGTEKAYICEIPRVPTTSVSRGGGQFQP
ncbi:cochlin-like [Oculina patagonica]